MYSLLASMSRLVMRWAARILLFGIISTLLLMMYVGQPGHNAEDMQHTVRQRKLLLVEELRREKIKVLQKTIFQQPKRPPDHTYNINVTLSERISLERDVLDSRPELCKSIVYDYNILPTVSIVIPFYNEALSMLLRTVHSILRKTPPDLLREIILVNDHSPNEDLGVPLEKYIKLLPENVKLLRTKKREGLIRARMIGASRTTGEVLMFQDAHTEANVGWAEPLLEEIRLNRRTIIQPFVEQVEAETIEYIPATRIVPRGGFSWDLRYTWMEIPDHELKRIGDRDWVPFRAATLVGCALAVDKKYFYEIGGFDDAMNVWGGENIELAFRNWMCHGQVLTHPCSRVAHTFKPFSYKFDGDREKIVQKNLMRIAEVWMDDWKDFFYAATFSWEFKHTYFTEKDLISLERRREKKRQLQCHGFDWYMKTITPEIPTPKRNADFYGEVASTKSEACFAMGNDGYLILTYFCFFHRVLPQNLFYLDTDGRLRFKNDRCLRVEPSTMLIKVGECSKNPTEDEEWRTTPDSANTGTISVRLHKLDKLYCITQVTNINPQHYQEQMPQLGECTGSAFQHWRWTYHFNFKYNFDKPL